MGLFQDVKPTDFLWVTVDGSDRNPGSKDTPMASIQAAIDTARPGTAVLVEAGTYFENVKVTQSGTESEPIWLVSADGDREAVIVPLIEGTSTVYGRGVDNFVMSGFEVDGADQQHGIEFTQAGRNYQNWVNNIVLENNHVNETGLDGIKLAQTVNVEVRGNTIIGGAEEAIDLVTVYDAVISGNLISGLEGRSGITAKGGSERILIEKNSIRDVTADAITVGGWTDYSLLERLSLEFQAKDVIVRDNFIEGVGKRSINVLGGQDVTIVDNYIDPKNDYESTINIQSGRWRLNSKDITIEENIITRDNWLKINDGQGSGLIVGENYRSAPTDHASFRPTQTPTAFTWLQDLRVGDQNSPPSAPPSDSVASWPTDHLFDGVDDRQVIDHEASLALASGTISFSFNADDLEGVQGLLSKDSLNFGDGGHLSVWLDNDQLVARLQSTDASYTLKSAQASVQANVDTHVALTFGDDGFKVYLDGNLAGADAFTGSILNNQEPLVVGGLAVYSDDFSADVVTNFFKGDIGEIEVRSDVLDPGEIKELAADLAPPSPDPAIPSDLVAMWQIDHLFDGVDDRQVIDHTDDLEILDGNVTVTFTPSAVSGTQGLVSKDAKYFGEGGHFTMYLEDGKLVARLQDKEASYTVETPPGSIRPGEDTTASVEFGFDGMRLILNGQLADTNSYVGGISENSEPLVIGASAIYSREGEADVLTHFFSGQIHEVSLANHESTATHLGFGDHAIGGNNLLPETSFEAFDI